MVNKDFHIFHYDGIRSRWFVIIILCGCS